MRSKDLDSYVCTTFFVKIDICLQKKGIDNFITFLCNEKCHRSMASKFFLYNIRKRSAEDLTSVSVILLQGVSCWQANVFYTISERGLQRI